MTAGATRWAAARNSGDGVPTGEAAAGAVVAELAGDGVSAMPVKIGPAGLRPHHESAKITNKTEPEMTTRYERFIRPDTNALSLRGARRQSPQPDAKRAAHKQRHDAHSHRNFGRADGDPRLVDQPNDVTNGENREQ